jgi:hypothetical protein
MKYDAEPRKSTFNNDPIQPPGSPILQMSVTFGLC